MHNWQLNKSKSAIKNGTEVALNLSSDLTGNSNDETNFPHKSLLTDAQASKISKAFANGLWGNMKFSKTLFIAQLGRSLYDSIDQIFNLIKKINKIINKADELSKKVTLNDIIKTADTSKVIINAFENASKNFWSRSNSKE